jgi:hypothetical protein
MHSKLGCAILHLFITEGVTAFGVVERHVVVLVL